MYLSKTAQLIHGVLKKEHFFYSQKKDTIKLNPIFLIQGINNFKETYYIII